MSFKLQVEVVEPWHGATSALLKSVLFLEDPGEEMVSFFNGQYGQERYTMQRS